MQGFNIIIQLYILLRRIMARYFCACYINLSQIQLHTIMMVVSLTSQRCGMIGTMDGGTRSPSMMWMIPLDATISFTSRGIPFSVSNTLPWGRRRREPIRMLESTFVIWYIATFSIISTLFRTFSGQHLLSWDKACSVWKVGYVLYLIVVL